MKFFFVSICLGLMGVASMRAENADELFRRGNEKYAAGDFRAAIADYESVARAGEWSANLFYNLGNAYDRTEDFGHAILSYERALALERNHPEAKTNLQLARDQAQIFPPKPEGWRRFLDAIDLNACAIAAAIFFWLGIGLLVWKARGAVIAVAALSLIVAAALATALFVQLPQTSRRAVVTGEKIEARVATADSAKSILALPAGTEIRVLEQRGDWSYVVLPNEQRGWIPATAAELIRLWSDKVSG